MKMRPFQNRDREACIEIFRGNVPTFFLEAELPEFVKYLDDDSRGPFFVWEQDAAVIACGGFWIEENVKRAHLCWGMVARAHQGRGVGRLLLRGRIRQICDLGAASTIVIHTSQRSRGFFEKEGFKVRSYVENGYGAGLDRFDLMLNLPTPEAPAD